MLANKAKPPTYTMYLTVTLVVTGLLYLISADAARVFLVVAGLLIGLTLLCDKVLKPFVLYLFTSVVSILADFQRLLAGVHRGVKALLLYLSRVKSSEQAESEPASPENVAPATPVPNAPGRVLN